MTSVKCGKITFGNERPFVLIGGPCVIESEKHAFDSAVRLKKIAAAARVPYIFKSSYDKATRSSVDSFRGPGLVEGLRILGRIKRELGLPVLTDVHTAEEAARAAEVVDVIQIPAFLCRQTDLLLAAGRTGVVVNVKKGQFLAPWDMKNVVRKIESTGNKRLLLTERGASFGYNNLLVDMRGLEIMKSFGYPVVYDATHSVQLPGGLGTSSGGQREFVLPLAKAATAIGLSSLFMEIHPSPEHARSDGPNSVRTSDLSSYLSVLKKIDRVVKGAASL
jgi:2-dehydro-3-deoxyphosphooctonate aldolase (KDO 8-P synthase)